MKEIWNLVPGLCVAVVVIIVATIAFLIYLPYADSLEKILFSVLGWFIIVAGSVRLGSLYDITRGD